jgi:hypothetical protein
MIARNEQRNLQKEIISEDDMIHKLTQKKHWTIGHVNHKKNRALYNPGIFLSSKVIKG